MRVSIFIKSWLQDLEWLAYALRFLECHWMDEEPEIVIVLDENCRGEFDPSAFAFDLNVYYRVPWPDGYCHAMFIKTLADHFCTSNYILLMDSDCMLLEPIYFRELFVEPERPLIGFVRYDEHLALFPHSPWKKVTERLIKEKATHHYMSRSPILYHRETFEGMRNWIAELHNRYYDAVVYSDKEFNPLKFGEHPITLMDYDLLGTYANRFELERYQFAHEFKMPPNRWHQYHSWSQDPQDLGLHRSLQIAFSHRLRDCLWHPQSGGSGLQQVSAGVGASRSVLNAMQQDRPNA
jgi:hypothetical protein